MIKTKFSRETRRDIDRLIASGEPSNSKIASTVGGGVSANYVAVRRFSLANKRARVALKAAALGLEVRGLSK